MSLAYRLDDTRIWRCDVCGKEQAWGEGWVMFGSILDMDVLPQKDLFTVCSDDCRGHADMLMKNGSISVPKGRHRGYHTSVSGKRRGY